MSFPTGDWQFWAVTALALGAAVWMLRGILPIPGLKKRRARRRSERSASLTIKGKAISRHR